MTASADLTHSTQARGPGPNMTKDPLISKDEDVARSPIDLIPFGGR